MKDMKYQPLTEYLLKSRKKELSLTVAELQEILGFPLDASAFQYREFWANCTASTKAYSWMDAGYEIISADLKNGIISFRQKDWL